MGDDKFDMKKWEEKRRMTFYVFIYQTFITGVEYSIAFLTLWIYITTLVPTDHPKLFYGLIAASSILPGFILSGVVGRWVDKTRSVRLTLIVCNTIVIIGNLLYVVYLSPWFLVVARFICGLSGTLRPVITGLVWSGIIRSFPGREMSKKLSTKGMAFFAGLILGPAMNFIFRSVNFHIGDIHVTFANVLGFYMAGLFICADILTILFVSDLSKEYDLKAYEEKAESDSKSQMTDTENAQLFKNEDVKTSDEEGFNNDNVQKKTLKDDDDGCDDEKPSSTDIPLKMLQNFDILFIFMLTYVLYFWMIGFDMWLPMLVVNTLQMGVNELTVLVSISAILTIVILLFFTKKTLSDRDMFNLSIVCLIALGVMQFIIVLLKTFHLSYVANMVLLVLWEIMFSMPTLIDDIFTVTFLAKVTSTKFQTFAESFRQCASLAGSMTALLTSAIAFDVSEYVCIGGIVLDVLLVIILIVRRKTFLKPSLIIQ